MTNRVGGKPGGEVERIGDVDQDLAVQVLRAGERQDVQRSGAAGGIDDELGTGGGIGEAWRGRRPGAGRPLGVGRVAHLVGVGVRERGLGVAGADADAVAELVEPAGEGAADRAGAEDCDVHGALLVEEATR